MLKDYWLNMCVGEKVASLKELSTDFKAFSSVATLTRLPSEGPNVGVAVPGLSLVL